VIPTAPLAPGYRERPYWWEGVEPPRGERGALPDEADVVVVGGGYTGMGAALELGRRGRSVLVLEAREPGWGASSRNGGQVLPDVKHHTDDLLKKHGPAGPALQAATVESVLQLERLVEEERIDCGYVRSGHLYLAHCESHVPELREMERMYREDMGMEATFVPPDELGEEIGSRVHAGGLVVPLSGGLHPARFFAGLARATISAGAVVHGGVRVHSIERRGAGFEVTTPNGTVRSGQVLVATNAYTDGVAPRLRRRVVPIGSFIIATEQIPAELAREISPRGRMFFDTKNFLFYWRLSPDGTRVLFGGRASLAPTTVARARDFLYRGMVHVHPQLEGVRVEYAWGGLVALTMDRTPRLGRRDGVTYSMGYSGTGVAEATWFGRLAGRWLAGEDPPPFADMTFPRIPGHRLLPLALPFVGLWYKLQDRCRPGRRAARPNPQ
jgi:glycine/D-amino acid oxidase-like deaminating enzyme